MARPFAKTSNQRPKPTTNSSDLSTWDEQLPIPQLSLLFASLLVFVLATGCFLNSRNGDFVFDDSEAILNNKDLQPETPLYSLFHHDFWGGKLASKTSHKSYRPFTVLTFRLNRYLADSLRSSDFHAINIVLHGIVSVLMLNVFALLFAGGMQAGRGLWDSSARRMALLCAVLFAVHPVHTESVAGAVGRADLLCACCFLLSFMAYARACVSGYGVSASLWLVSSMQLCIASTLFKEQGITVLGICSAYDIILVCKIDLRKFFQNTKPKLNKISKTTQHDWFRPLIVRHVLLLVTGVTILISRWSIMGWTAPVFQVNDNPHSFVNGSLLRAVNYNYIYSLNAWLLVNPWWLCFDWSMGCVPIITSFTDLRILSAVAFWVVVGWLLSSCLSKHVTTYHRRLLTMSLALMIVPFLPASNLLFRVGFVIAERALYLPVAGFCLLVGLGARQICCAYPAQRKFVRWSLIVLILIFITRSVQRSAEWTTEQSLFESGVNVCPLNAKVQYNIAKIHGDAGNTEMAIEKYRLAISLNPQYDQAMNNLGNILKERGETLEAETLLENAVKIRPEFAAAWMNLGIVQASLKKNESAEHSYRTAIRHRRRYPDCYYNLGNLYLDLGRHEDALRAWRNATALKPSHVNAWSNMLILYDNLGQRAEIESAAAEALRHLPTESVIYYNLANFQGKMGLFSDSEINFLKAIELDPKNAGYYSNLGVLYHRWGKLEDAERAYKSSLQLNPAAAQTQTNLNMLYKKMATRSQSPP